MAKETQKSEWPKTLWCTQQGDGEGSYIMALRSPDGFAEPDNEVAVAVYQFVGMSKVTAPVMLNGKVYKRNERGLKGGDVE